MDMTEKEGEEAYGLHRMISTNERTRRELLAESIKNLIIMRDKKLYRAILGDENTSWSAYLSQMELFYTRSEINKAIKVYQKFVTELGADPMKLMSEVSVSRLAKLVPYVTAENWERLFDEVKVLTPRDFSDLIHEMAGEKQSDLCEHEDKPYLICNNCGRKIIDHEHETIKPVQQ